MTAAKTEYSKGGVTAVFIIGAMVILGIYGLILFLHSRPERPRDPPPPVIDQSPLPQTIPEAVAPVPDQSSATPAPPLVTPSQPVPRPGNQR